MSTINVTNGNCGHPYAAAWWPVAHVLGALSMAQPYVVGFLVGVLTTASLIPILSGRTSPPAYGREAAVRAYEQAERRGAQRWAPRPLAAAKKSLDQGLFEYRRQASRFLPLRDFAEARLILSQAEHRSWEAARAAVLARRSAKERAQEQLRQAEELVTIGRDFGIIVPLSPYERTLLARAQLALNEAKQRALDGSYAAAEALASEAESLATRIGTACSDRAGRYADTALVSLGGNTWWTRP